MAMNEAEGDDALITSINITPLVDIFLVLLIIFMITSTVIAEKQLNVELPKAAHAGEDAPKAAGLILDRDGRLFLEGQPADSARVDGELRRRVSVDPELQVLIGADESLAYREIIKVIDMVKASGVHRYALKVAHPSP